MFTAGLGKSEVLSSSEEKTSSLFVAACRTPRLSPGDPLASPSPSGERRAEPAGARRHGVGVPLELVTSGPGRLTRGEVPGASLPHPLDGPGHTEASEIA